MSQRALATVFTVGLTVAAPQTSWAQNGEMLPEDPELYPAEPYDGCVDTLGEMIDLRAMQMGVHPMLLRNLYRDILDEAEANTDPNTPPQDLIDVPSFNERLEQLDPELRELLAILFKDPTAGKSFGMGCDLET
ncbi:MAG: hypothetical protein JKY71_08460 [Alphaproteobacteria bacterium]|nr:hypothetical protein [Alphaproteobacteria bacterium]